MRRVIAKKTFLFLKPDKKAKSRTYLVMGDLVGVISQSGGWNTSTTRNGSAGGFPRLTLSNFSPRDTSGRAVGNCRST
jgi:hypothetical protein